MLLLLSAKPIHEGFEQLEKHKSYCKRDQRDQLRNLNDVYGFGIEIPVTRHF